MKAKRKVHLSGYWWFPIRSFEFSTSRPLAETIESIQLLTKLRLFGFNTFAFVKERKDKDGQLIIDIRTNGVARGHYTYISGYIEQLDNCIKISGEVGIAHAPLWTITFFVHLVFTVAIYLFTFTQSGMLGSPIFGFLIVGHAVFYMIALWLREREFDKFMNAIQSEKVKVGQV